MALCARKVFLIILTMQIGIFLAYVFVRTLTSYAISWHDIHTLGLKTLTQDSNLIVQSANISKSATEMSPRSLLTYWPSRRNSVKETAVMSSMRTDSGETRGSARTANDRTAKTPGAQYNKTNR